MSLVDSLLNVMHMNPDDDDDYYDDDYDEEEEEVVPRRSRSAKEKEPAETSYRNSGNSNQPIDINRNRDRSTQRTGSKVTPMRPSRKVASNGMEVCIIRPMNFDDAREITETLLMNRPVILNVEGLDVDIAQRIIDCTSGSCFAINGNLQPVSKYIFIVTPANIDISGDVQSWLDSSYGSTESLRMDFS